MTGILARRAFQVAGLAAGIVLFGGGMASAAGTSVEPEGGHHGNHSRADIDQDATNICGNNAGNGGIMLNGTDCDATDAAFAAVGDDYDYNGFAGGHHGDRNRADIDQDATNVCGNNLGNGGIIVNMTDCDATNLAAVDE